MQIPDGKTKDVLVVLVHIFGIYIIEIFLHSLNLKGINISELSQMRNSWVHSGILPDSMFKVFLSVIRRIENKEVDTYTLHSLQLTVKKLRRTMMGVYPTYYKGLSIGKPV
jgi:hypothetical protein